jgi:signal transduction histidine kinase
MWRQTFGHTVMPSWKKLELTARLASDRHQLLVTSGIALAIVAVIAVALGWFVAGRVLRPVRTITATARRISATDLHQRLGLDGAGEEFKQLADTLDDLFARLEASFEAQRHFVANASHELRTPLTRERTLLQVALGDPSTPAVWQSTGQELLASNREQERLIEALLALASSQSGIDHSEMIDLSAVCDNVLQRCHLDTDQLGLRIDTDTRSAALTGEPRLIERLIANLLDNAIKHNISGGRVHISTGTTDGKAVIAVTNTGPVVPSGDVHRLFQPFQRLDPRRARTNGHGLGLSIVQAIATAHGADITAHPPADGGLAVQVTFPRPPDCHTGPGRTPRALPNHARDEMSSPLAQPRPQASPATSPLLTSPPDGS